MTGRDGRYLRLSAAARGIALLALVGAVLWSRDARAAPALVAVGVIWGLAQTAQSRSTRPVTGQVTLEAALIGAVCGFAIHTSPVVLGALAVTPFTSGLRAGWRGVAVALSAQLAALGAISVVLLGGLSVEQGIGALTGVVAGLGLGLIAGFVNATRQQSSDPLAPYRSAQALIRQLIDLSGGLSSGLDPVPLGGAILSAVRDELPTAVLVLYVPRGDSLTPLLTKTTTADVDSSLCDELAVEAWALSRPIVDAGVFALPLITEAGTTAVVAGLLSERIDPGQLGLERRIRQLGERLAASAVHLDTALLFAALRDEATVEERRRLAREMHDGVAQDIASLGYLVDALAARPTSPEQAARIGVLRDRITAMVAEVRRSLINLRTQSGASESLGAAIGSIARNLTEVSGVPIQVTLDERTTRLRPEVEAELFRIAQEALTNAVRHARASTIDVNCQVHAPAALITITDNGLGLQEARSDSQGLDIMRERALLIGACLSISAGVNGGTVVSVKTPCAPDDTSASSAAPDAIVRV